MPTDNYFSLLICDRQGDQGPVDLYANGQSLGQIKDGKLEFDPRFDARNPKANAEELADYLEQLASRLRGNPTLNNDESENVFLAAMSKRKITL